MIDEKEETKTSTSFSYWKKQIDTTSSGSDQEKKVLQEMAKLAKTFEEWTVVYEDSPAGSKIESRAISEMAKLDN